MQPVHADAAAEAIGKILPVQIVGVRSNSLTGITTGGLEEAAQ
jgi:hypothetical protein